MGVGQWEDKLTFNLFVSLLAAPNRQKLLNHTGFAFAGGGAKPYEGGGGTVVGVAGVAALAVGGLVELNHVGGGLIPNRIAEHL